MHVSNTYRDPEREREKKKNEKERVAYHDDDTKSPSIRINIEFFSLTPS